MNKKYFSFLLAAVLLIGCIAVGVSAAEPVATIETQAFSSLQEAVNAYTDTSKVIKLLADTSENVSISKTVYLDLNSHDVTGTVTVSAGTLYCMDTQTDDYTINDTAGYGIVSNVSGNVAGAPATAARNGYLMIAENAEKTSFSFHCVNLKIHTMTLRPENVGLYYKCAFAGDELVAQNVASYGIALSVKEVPTAQNLASKCKYSTFTDFNAGSNESDSTSTLLKNVMKTSNAQLINNRNSQMPVYGRAYVLTKDNEYVFGNAVNRTLADQVKDTASDTYWKPLSKEQKESMVNMYRKYTSVMKSWGVKNIESALCLDTTDPLSTKTGTLKVLAITSSFGLNTTQFLYDVAVAEGYAPENVTVARLYASGCTLAQHIKNAPNTPFYQYTKVSGDPDVVSEYGGTVGKMATVFDVGTATLLDGLLDEEWDIIFMQQGARQAALLDTYVDANGNNYIDQLKAIVDQYNPNPNARFVWNMLWAFQGDSEQKPFNTVFNYDQTAMYQANITAVTKYVVPRTDYDRIIPTGSVLQNARTSYFGDKLCKDTYHLNDLGCTLAAYGLYAVITGQELTEINLDIVATSGTNGIGSISHPLTAEDKMVIMESVNNALRTPFGVTFSQYPPKDYSSYTYTENLQFIDNTDYAVCPACNAEVKWTKVTQENHETLGFGTQMAAAHYHFCLSEDVEYTGSANAFIYSPSSGRTFCLHLNGNDLTATNNAISVTASNTVVNIMGTGTVSGNHISSSKYRGSAIVLNSGTNGGMGTVRLYSGTYIQPTGNTQLAPVSTAHQGGLLEIYADAVIYGNTNSVCLNTSNGSKDGVDYMETVNIYGGTFYKTFYTYAAGAITSTTSLNISGGTFKEGVKLVDSNTVVTLSGAPVIEGAGLVLPEGVTVTLGELATGANIAVDANGAFTLANVSAQDYLKYFTAVKNGFAINAENNVLYCKEF